MSVNPQSNSSPHSLSVVIPVFRGEQTLESVVNEIISMRATFAAHMPSLVLNEIILVHDCGPDRSDEVMRNLAREHHMIKNVWLARNSGQHAATLAGMASSTGDWIVTMDEDGQHDPSSIPLLLDRARKTKSELVYGRPINPPPHGAMRNLASRFTKRVVLPLLTGGSVQYFSSFRLVLGEVGRSLAAYASNDVYLDVALSWVIQSTTTQDVKVRQERRSMSGYSRRSLASHFFRLVLSAGTGPLRLAGTVGICSFIAGLLVALAITIGKIWYGFTVVGWASLFSLLLTLGGLILLVLGVIAEYIGLLVRNAIGRPLYVIVNDRASGPLDW